MTAKCDYTLRSGIACTERPQWTFFDGWGEERYACNSHLGHVLPVLGALRHEVWVGGPDDDGEAAAHTKEGETDG